jgi:hypothetical protein
MSVWLSGMSNLALPSILIAQAGGQTTNAVSLHSDSSIAPVPYALGDRFGLSLFTYDHTTPDTMMAVSPTRCVVAALWEEFRALRTAAVQQTRLGLRPDTFALAPATVREAQRCGKPWFAMPSNVQLDSLQWIGLFRLDLIAQYDTQALAIGQRWIRNASSQDIARGERILQVLQWMNETRPRTLGRLRLLQQLYAQLQALAPGAVEERIDATVSLMNLAGQSGDFSQQLGLARATQQMIRTIPTAEPREYFREAMFSAERVELNHFFLQPFDLASPQLHAAIEQYLAQLRSDFPLIIGKHHYPVIIPTTFSEFMFSHGRIRNDSLIAGEYLHSAQPVVAQYWYDRPDTTVTYPRHGVLTVIAYANVCGSSGDACERRYAAWKQLYAEFARRGVDFILVASTTGSFGRSNLLPVTAEVDSLRTYFLDRKKLPGILAVKVRNSRTLSDGRKVELDGPTEPFGVVTQDGLLWRDEGNFDKPQDIQATEVFLKNQLAALHH